jgi:hypothetical protein
MVAAMSKRTASTDIETLRASKKFKAWHVPLLSVDELMKNEAADERHFSPDEL